MASPEPASTVRIFIDSSVLFAAAISPAGGARALLRRGIHGQVRLIISPLVLEEVERNLSRKAPAALPAFQSLRDALGTIVIEPAQELIDQVAATIELKDAPIVAGAIAASAAYVATHDQKHLLRQRDQIRADFGLIVATPGDVLAQVFPSPDVQPPNPGT